MKILQLTNENDDEFSIISFIMLLLCSESNINVRQKIKDED